MAGISSSINPYIAAALIGAIPATISSIAAWKNSHLGRKENSSDHAKVQGALGSINTHLESLDTKIERQGLAIDRLDLRFDGIEDKVERHLGWHRSEAEMDLPAALKKELRSDLPNN
jgi:hypothetical protein